MKLKFFLVLFPILLTLTACGQVQKRPIAKTVVIKDVVEEDSEEEMDYSESDSGIGSSVPDSESDLSGPGSDVADPGRGEAGPGSDVADPGSDAAGPGSTVADSNVVDNAMVHALYEDIIQGRRECEARSELAQYAEYNGDIYGTYYDLNHDGLDELIVVSYGPFDIYTYLDGEIVYAGSTFGYSSGSPSFLLSSGEVLTVDASHAGREYYQVFELTRGGELRTNIIYFREFPDPGYEIEEESFSMTYDPDDELEEISKEQFEHLRDRYDELRLDVEFQPLHVVY